MSAAHDAADPLEVERVRRHLVAEGSTDATEAAHIDTVNRASLLAKDMIEAVRGGDDARAGDLRRQMVAEFRPGSSRRSWAPCSSRRAGHRAGSTRTITTS